MSEATTTEERVQALCDARDHDAAATLIIDQHGPSIYGFLVATMGDETAGAEVFSMWCEDVWKGLEGFRWGCSLKTWLYTVARHAGHRWRRAPFRKRHHQALSQSPFLSKLVVDARKSITQWRRTESRNQLQELRQELEPDDQTLLILRVDREMSWKEVAQVMHGVDEEDATLKRHAATLRKRFERVKRELRQMALDRGLIEPG